jgi:hypothetical protein
VQLDLAAAIDKVEKSSLAGATARGDASGDAVAILGLLANLQVLVGSAHFSDRLDIREGVRCDLGPVRTQALRLCTALGDQLGQTVRRVLLGDMPRVRARSIAFLGIYT